MAIFFLPHFYVVNTKANPDNHLTCQKWQKNSRVMYTYICSCAHKNKSLERLKKIFKVSCNCLLCCHMFIKWRGNYCFEVNKLKFDCLGKVCNFQRYLVEMIFFGMNIYPWAKFSGDNFSNCWGHCLFVEVRYNLADITGQDRYKLKEAYAIITPNRH